MNTYRPTSPPAGIDPRIAEYLTNELERIAAVFPDPRLVNLDETNAAPTKPRKGDVRLADGTNWNPGSGAGFYGYYGGAWVKLG